MRLSKTLRIVLVLVVWSVLMYTSSARKNRQRNTEGRRTDVVPRPRRNRVEISDTRNNTNAANNASAEETALPTTTDARKRKRKNKRQRKRKQRNRRKGKKLRKFAEETASTDLFSDEVQKELLRNTVSEMFGFDHMTSPRPGQTRSSVPETRVTDIELEQGLPHPPDFMLQLYKTFSADRDPVMLPSRTQGNTVRSFFSVAGDTLSRPRDKGKPILIVPATSTGSNTAETDLTARSLRVFAFNITSIPDTESVVKAELRIDCSTNDEERAGNGHNASRREWQVVLGSYRQHSGQNGHNETLNFFQRAGNLVRLSQTSATAWTGEHIFDIIRRARRDGHLIIVQFEDELQRHRRNAASPLPDNQSSREAVSTPVLPDSFTVLDSERSKRNTGRNRHGGQQNRPGDVFDSLAAVSASPLLIVYTNDSKTVLTKSSGSLSERILLSSLGNITASLAARNTRVRRSAGTRRGNAARNGSNSLPGEDTPENEQRSIIPVNLPQSVDNDQTELHDNGLVDRAVIQSLTDQKTARKKKRRRKPCRKRGRRAKRKCKKASSTAPEADLNGSQQTCSRKSLTVDFADIGWSQWIISPTRFDAYYCSGLCRFKNIKNAQFSNHAIIQAVIKAFNVRPKIPAPCCVPDEMTTLNVLFFDKDDNVVLKAYPDMQVKTCGCR
uniref:Transforming growth factor beta superfamily signaling ligand n=1 Tax=Ciona intestinalis TaxID=7719 RepID=Q4H3U5_CIOIN|nr:transforming growth factor beta superfamily signaling ligand precursor [Ciona intestinalis]BAE06332.1 transforming growth factor beta superfamily signaling ligand [Ciona intestinalis]|eukprot:NP_001071987.1 transforming growth factor beta superfamily signaling ligand precursor [Ciona intestinalis]